MQALPKLSTNGFGEHLRTLRHGRSLTLRALAAASAIDFTLVSKWETGKRPAPDPRTAVGRAHLRRLSQALNINESDAIEAELSALALLPDVEPDTKRVLVASFLRRGKS